MPFPPMWSRAKRSRLLSWTTPGESQRLFVWPADLDVFDFWFSQGDVWLKCVFCFNLTVSAMRWISSMKANMLKDDLFYCYLFPSMSFKSKLNGKLQWISRWWFLQLNTCFWMMCFGTLHKNWGTNAGTKLRQVSLMGWQVKRPARSDVDHYSCTRSMVSSRYHVLFWKEIWDIFFLVNIQHLQNGEEFVQLSYNNISPRRRWCFPSKNVNYERSFNLGMLPRDPTSSWWWRLKIASWKGQLIDAAVYLNYPGRNFMKFGVSGGWRMFWAIEKSWKSHLKIFLKSKVYRPPHEIQNKSNPNSMNKNSIKYQRIQQKTIKLRLKTRPFLIVLKLKPV